MFVGVGESFTDNYKVVLIDFLGHGKSDRVDSFSTDLWHDEALQVIALIEQAQYKKVNLIGSSGGAIVAINVALERPDLVNKVIADSFEGETPLQEFVENLSKDREATKRDEGGKAFFNFMHGEGWEKVVDNDTRAIREHAKTIGTFFHRPLSDLHTDILLTGSREDEFVKGIQQIYTKLVEKIGHGEMHIFEHGKHPALMSEKEAFISIAKGFLGHTCNK